MAFTITCLDDANHTISVTKPIIARQSEIGEVATFAVPVALYATYPCAYVHYFRADGVSAFITNGGTPFDYAGDGNFTYTLGTHDNMLEADGRLGIQVVLRDVAPPNTTKEWRSRILYVTVENSIMATEDSSAQMIQSLTYGALGSINDVDVTGLADGDILIRNTTTGKWENFALVDGSNIITAINKTLGTLTISASGTVSTEASAINVTDVGSHFTGADAETIFAELGVHKDSTANPHSVTAAQVGLGNVTNESKATMFTNPSLTGLVTTAGQIKFPATQNPSADVNTLDDYEEGSFSPTAYGSTSAGTPTYSVQQGYYTKIGRLVHFSLFVACTAHTGTGKLYIGGLPFAANGLHPLVVGYVAYLTIGSGTLIAYVESGANFIKIGLLTSGTIPALIDMDASFEITITGSYMV